MRRISAIRFGRDWLPIARLSELAKLFLVQLAIIIIFCICYTLTRQDVCGGGPVRAATPTRSTGRKGAPQRFVSDLERRVFVCARAKTATLDSDSPRSEPVGDGLLSRPAGNNRLPLGDRRERASRIAGRLVSASASSQRDRQTAPVCLRSLCSARNRERSDPFGARARVTSPPLPVDKAKTESVSAEAAEDRQKDKLVYAHTVRDKLAPDNKRLSNLRASRQQWSQQKRPNNNNSAEALACTVHSPSAVYICVCVCVCV